MVCVISYSGQPLMPTENHAKVRILLKQNKAKVIRSCPFTIQLTYESTTHTQPVSLGIDAGSKHIGVSATTEDKVLYEADVVLRNDIVKLLSTRRELRRSRRNRKTRYRKCRFLNRVHSKHKGWLAPSVEAKINTHMETVKKVCGILPVSAITVETASFDIRKIKALKEGKDIPEGTDYQQGEQLGFWNVREYVLCRDGHTCQCCKGKSKDRVLNVHHIESRKTGGDAPNNLITLCETCHKGYHKGTVKLPEEIHRGMKFTDAAFMGIMRWTFYERLKNRYEARGIPVKMTFGYITKNTRITHGLPKEHYVDARCISGHPEAEPPEYVYYQRKVRCHNRQIHKNTVLKGGYRKRNQAPYEVMGFRLYDKVKWKGQTCFIFGRRTTGRMDLRLLDGTKVNASAGYKNLRLSEMRKNILTESRKVV